jgi:hypothetical protein
MIDFDAKVLEVQVHFEGDKGNGSFDIDGAEVYSRPIYPSALGSAEYRGDVYEFQVNERNCLTGQPIKPADANFVVWLDDFESEPVNPKPCWAEEDDDLDWMYEVESAISIRPEVISIKSDLQRLSLHN